MLNIIGHRKKFFIFSSILIILAIAATVKWGFKFSVEFTSGAVSEITFDARPDNKAIEDALGGLDLGSKTITPSGDKEVFIRTKVLDDETHQKMISGITEKFPNAKEVNYNLVGSDVSKEFIRNMIWAILMSVVGISLYVSWAFRKVTRPISSWKYGVVSIVTLFHDVIIPVGLFAFLGHYRGIEVDTAFFVAILTILGYSINDTIVVFDRTRENLLKHNSKDFEEVVNRSVNQTFIRSINTSLTVIIVLLALYFFGGESLKYFSLALLVGVITGAYSSIFIASPLLVEWQQRNAK